MSVYTLGVSDTKCMIQAPCYPSILKRENVSYILYMDLTTESSKQDQDSSTKDPALNMAPQIVPVS